MESIEKLEPKKYYSKPDLYNYLMTAGLLLRNSFEEIEKRPTFQELKNTPVKNRIQKIEL